jgi:predicted Ser/Thr protein kinase
MNSKEILIGNEVITFFEQKKLGQTSDYYIDASNRYFMKIPKNFLEYDCLKREVFMLKKLAKYSHFPKLVAHDDTFIITHFIGEKLNSMNKPVNYEYQKNEILKILETEKIRHCDIKAEELLVKDGILYLVDFGWAMLDGRLDCGIGISNKIKNCVRGVAHKKTDRQMFDSIVR